MVTSLMFWNLDEEAEAQGGEVTWPGSWDKVVAEPGPGLRSPDFPRALSMAPWFVRPEPGSLLGLLSRLSWPGSLQSHGHHILHADFWLSSEERRPEQNHSSASLPWVVGEPLALRENRSRILKILVQILTLLITHCVTLGKLLYLFDH